MYLKKLAENKMVTVDYYTNCALQTIKGRVYKLNVVEQIISLKDEK